VQAILDPDDIRIGRIPGLPGTGKGSACNGGVAGIGSPAYGILSIGPPPTQAKVYASALVFVLRRDYKLWKDKKMPPTK